MVEAFRFHDGAQAHTPTELLSALEAKRTRYHEHVHADRNDFANWLDYAGEPTLAKAMRESRTREESIAALRQQQRHHEIVYRERPIAAFFLGAVVGIFFCMVMWAIIGALR